MLRFLVCSLMGLMFVVGWSQEVGLPTDFRQHNLTQFNANLLNATYTSDWNNPNSFSIWTRWQWQSVDGDPTTIFANYSHQINTTSTVALGFLQHNTGVFLNVGANFNYVHTFPLDDGVELLAGINLFAFQNSLADDRFVPDPDLDLPELESSKDFMLQFSPAVRLNVNQFSVGLAFENGFGFNLSDSGNGPEGFQIVTGILSNDFNVELFPAWGDSFVRPMVYVKSVPNADTQFGLNTLLSTPKFWAQGGYNSFYGVSGGVGVTFAHVFSIGGLMEFGGDSELSDDESTFELIASYQFGKTDNRKNVIGFDVEKDDALAQERMAEEARLQRLKEQEAQEVEQLRRQQLTEEQRVRDSIAQAELEASRLEEQQDSIAQARKQQEQDSLAQVLEQRKQDSIAAIQQQEVELLPNERYEEVASEDGLEPGFYLITNVFGTKKYYESFMLTLKQKGLDPKSFYRSINKYNYVYLERYNTMEEARRARDSQFNGKYMDKIWIFRVRGK
ncbi:PorP/SprF family type IX secretion system membrane protein [Muricauda sp. CAU 1633]|uniref:PorP/SprF family type IX secretion system membrane protein n=1 Tax=Allomuricauda sp. CAU 1633 TaxID=2816036 RepID=UPI001A8D0059|nr:PorP/SprF family type IX secretion system membrane protein [Muricauda sp. CAU 1633]MBO0324196.1 PorP/SprF family type IX secretion system membrane protein [Muricauda sp. CAU 1633]